ncbi:hypothetical protein BOTBODRAFT_28373 [Botryobasidium botryosum FD-172 SS1]|uniref:Uncharacterized protein n=1 Tax=Botryobasidium botryosum (strain FD-172 SS1) TaxID=930990 RepID=A0A067N453_BOTB1|nr:hypothetical protein BOTBODRAFT_28373 [Botryobasidium botryosum FD-172 SS1]
MTRSKDLPPRIRLFTGGLPENKALKDLIAILGTCSDRWRSLSYDHLHMETLGLIFAHPVPNLETSQLDEAHGPGHEDGMTKRPAFKIPDGFFKGKAPRLRRLGYYHAIYH